LAIVFKYYGLLLVPTVHTTVDYFQVDTVLHIPPLTNEIHLIAYC